MVTENGARVSKILQVFSRQASLMDTLITNFVQQLKRKSSVDEVDRSADQLTIEGKQKAVYFDMLIRTYL